MRCRGIHFEKCIIVDGKASKGEGEVLKSYKDDLTPSVRGPSWRGPKLGTLKYVGRRHDSLII